MQDFPLLDLRPSRGKMYESVEVGGLAPAPNPFLVVDFYNQNRACLLQEKGLPAPGPYSTPLRTPLWNGSNHCTYRPPLCYLRSWGGVAVGTSLHLTFSVCLSGTRMS